MSFGGIFSNRVDSTFGLLMTLMIPPKVLRACDVEFETYDVLSNEAVRQKIKVKPRFG